MAAKDVDFDKLRPAQKEWELLKQQTKIETILFRRDLIEVGDQKVGTGRVRAIVVGVGVDFEVRHVIRIARGGHGTRRNYREDAKGR